MCVYLPDININKIQNKRQSDTIRIKRSIKNSFTGGFIV